MHKEFLLNILFLIAINLVIKPLYVFGVDLKVQNEVANYGLYFALLNFSYLFQIFADLGIYQYNNRRVAQERHWFGKHFPHLLSLKGGLSVGFLALSLMVAILLGYQGRALYLLCFLLLNQIFITLTFFFRSNLSGLEYYRLDSLLSVLDKLLLVCLGIPLLWGPWNWTVSLEGFVYLQSIAFGSTTLIAFLACWRLVEHPLRWSWKWPLLRVILKQSLPFSLVVLLMSLYTRIDAVMIERILYDPYEGTGIVQGNIYAAAYRLLDAVNMVGYLFAGLLLPMFARQIKAQTDVLPLLSLSTRLMLVITGSFSAAVCTHATSIMELLYTDYHPDMAGVLIWLMLGFNAIGIIHIVGTLLTARGNLRAMNTVFVAGIFLNASTNWVLIPQYGAWGAAVCTLLTQGLVALLEWVLVQHWLQLDWRQSSLWWQVPLFIGGLVSINYGCLQGSWGWGWSFVGAGLLSVGWAMLIGLLNIKRILSTFGQKTL